MSPSGVKAKTEMPQTSTRHESLTISRNTPTRSAATMPSGLTLQDSVGNTAVGQLLHAQRKAKAEGVRPVSLQMQHRINAQSSSGRPLDGPTRIEMESILATNLSGVQLHAGAAAAGLVSDLGARAFTQGRDVFLGPEAGADTLAHELTHASEGRTGPGTVQCDDSEPNPFVLADQPSDLEPGLEPDPFSMLAETVPITHGPALAPSAMTLPPVATERIFEVHDDPDAARSVFVELTPNLPADPLADALPLRATLGDELWQQLEAAATRRESLRRHQQMSYPEGSHMVDTTVNNVLVPATYADPGDVTKVWSTLKGDSEPSEDDQALVKAWAVVTAISGYRASVADYPAIVAIFDPDALEVGPTRLVLLLSNGRELPLDHGLVELKAMDVLAPQSLDEWGNQAAADATTILMSKTMIVQGTVQLKASEELAAACEKDHGNAVVAALEGAKLQTDTIVTASTRLGAAAGPRLTAIKSELETTSSAAAAASARIAGVIYAVRVFQFEKMGGSGRSLDEFWRRADDVFLVGTIFSFFSAGDSRYRAQRLQAIHDGTMSYNQFDAEMNGWKELLSSGVNMVTTFTAAKLAGPGATAVFGINAVWSPTVAAATRNVFASFATSIGNNVAVSIAIATSSPETHPFLESLRVSPSEAIMGAGLGFGLDFMLIRSARTGPLGAETSKMPIATETPIGGENIAPRAGTQMVPLRATYMPHSEEAFGVRAGRTSIFDRGRGSGPFYAKGPKSRLEASQPSRRGKAESAPRTPADEFADFEKMLTTEFGAVGSITSDTLLRMFRYGSRDTVVKYLKRYLLKEAKTAKVLRLGDLKLALKPKIAVEKQIDDFLKSLEGAHFVPQAFGKRLPKEIPKSLPGGEYNPNDALVVFTPKPTHTAMDQPWKDAFNNIRKGGEEATGQRVFDEVADGIRKTPHMSDSEKASRIARLHDEMFTELGVVPGGKYPIPRIFNWWEFLSSKAKVK